MTLSPYSTMKKTATLFSPTSTPFIPHFASPMKRNLITLSPSLTCYVVMLTGVTVDWLTVVKLTGVTMAIVRTVSAWLAGWASINCLALLCNVKDAASFYSGRWNTGTNPDLAFASVGPNSRLPDKRVLDKFPRSQHRSSLITPPRFAMAMPSIPVKRWNFRKAKWSHYIALTNKFAKTLLPPDSLDVDAAFQDFCNTIKKAVKKTIPGGYRNNYIPCWDAQCESLY